MGILDIPVITSYLRENPDLRNLGILLTFETGLRVGELAALRASDLNGRVIRIRRSEVKHRISTESGSKRLTSVCRKAGIPKRSMHKIRKTYGTTLIDSGVDEKFIQEQMGHRDITTTKKFYYFSNKSQKNKELQIERAFSS